MLVPAIAMKTYNELKNQAKSLAVVQLVLKKLNKLHQGHKRAEFIHRMIDEANQPVFDNPLVKQLSPCKKGCTACCHTQVSVTEDEASLLANKIHSGEVVIDLDRLKVQMKVQNDSSAFFSLPYEQKKCVFLDAEGGCTVYADRPSVCRTNAVLGSADQCDTSSGQKPQRLVKTTEADLVIYASYLHSKKSGALPHLLAKALGLLDS